MSSKFFVRKFVACSFIASIVVASAKSSWAHTETVQSSAAGTTEPAPKAVQTPLTVKPIDGVRIDGTGRGRFSFGVIDPLATTELRHTFTVRNDTKEAMVIDHLVASCHCTHADLADDGNGKRKLAPGEEATVKMGVDLDGPAGPLDKFIQLFANGSTEPIAILEMTGTVRETASFSAKNLDFGTMPSGTSNALPLTVTLDARLKSMNAVPPLVSNSPDIKVVLKSESLQPDAIHPISLIQLYEVSFTPKINQGAVRAAIKFGELARKPLDPKSATPAKLPPLAPPKATEKSDRPQPAETGSAPITASVAAATLTELSCATTGLVAGSVVMEPRLVIIQDAQVGKPSVAHVKLSSADRARIAGMKFSCANPNITTKLTPQAAPAADVTRGIVTSDLEIRVLPDAPGNIQAILTVTMGPNETTLLPLVAILPDAEKK